MYYEVIWCGMKDKDIDYQVYVGVGNQIFDLRIWQVDEGLQLQ